MKKTRDVIFIKRVRGAQRLCVLDNVMLTALRLVSEAGKLVSYLCIFLFILR